jgi:hypothetical protein
MGKIQAILDKVLEDALNVAITTLREEASGIVAASLRGALEARLKVLLEEAPTPEALTPEAPARAKAKVAALEEVREEPTPKVRRRKAKEVSPAKEDLESILEGVKAALQKYSGITTPKGKVYSDVLFRRVRKVLEHAQESGHNNLALLARSALAHINVDPKQVAMSSWQYLAGKLGLPVPVAQGE